MRVMGQDILIEEARPRKYYRKKDKKLLWDTSEIKKEELRAVLFIEGMKEQKENAQG